MTLSLASRSLLKEYMSAIEIDARSYREIVLQQHSPEDLWLRFPLQYATSSPKASIHSLSMEPGRRYARTILIGSHVSERRWHRQVKPELRLRAVNQLGQDLPLEKAELQEYGLLEHISDVIELYLDWVIQTYLILCIRQEPFDREFIVDLVLDQLAERFDGVTCHSYVGCFLYNFELESHMTSVDLSEDVVIRQTNHSDVTRKMGLLGLGDGDDDGPFLPPPYMLTVRLPDFPRALTYIGNIPGGSQWARTIEDVIYALRLLQPGYIGRGSIAGWIPGPVTSIGYVAPIVDDIVRSMTRNGPDLSPYRLHNSDVPSVVSTLKELQGSGRMKLAIALARFNDSYKRSDSRERILDLVIALESLFSEETVGQTTEVGYRLRMRAAVYLGNNLAERRRLRTFFSHLYELRSKIVHGDSQQVEETVRRRFNKSLGEVVEEAQEYLRQSLQRMLHNPTHRGQIYLNDLLLGA